MFFLEPHLIIGSDSNHALGVRGAGAFEAAPAEMIGVTRIYGHSLGGNEGQGESPPFQGRRGLNVDYIRSHHHP